MVGESNGGRVPDAKYVDIISSRFHDTLLGRLDDVDVDPFSFGIIPDILAFRDCGVLLENIDDFIIFNNVQGSLVWLMSGL